MPEQASVAVQPAGKSSIVRTSRLAAVPGPVNDGRSIECGLQQVGMNVMNEASSGWLSTRMLTPPASIAHDGVRA
jgi:hypothetical protein